MMMVVGGTAANSHANSKLQIDFTDMPLDWDEFEGEEHNRMFAIFELFMVGAATDTQAFH